MTDVSFVVPSLNEEKYIEVCLKSVKNQETKLDYELILSDSSSIDRTIEIAEKYVDKIIKAKKGIAFGRNTGGYAAKGDVLIFIDADTRIPPNYLNVIYSILLDHKVAGVSCAFKFDTYDLFSRLAERVSNDYLLLKSFNKNGTILGFNNGVRKELFKKVRGYPNKPLEDRAFGFKLEKYGKIPYLPEPVVTTSSRRLITNGALRSLNYYANLQMFTDYEIPVRLRAFFKSKKYKPVR